MKILLVRFSSIGDIVLTTPIIRVVKEQLQAEVHYVTLSKFRAIIINNPYIDKIHCLDDWSSLMSELKKQKFDLIIDMHKNLRSRRIIRNLGVDSISFNKINIRKWLMVNFKIDRLPRIHIVDRYFQALSKLQVDNDGNGLDYFFASDIDKRWKQQIKEEIVPLNNSVVIVLGATYFTKRIPTKLLHQIINTIDQPIILIGGKDVKDLSTEIVKDFPNKQIFDYCGEIDIELSAYIISKTTKVITGDTGMMHIAAALQKPIISIWGSTIPEFGMYPYYGDNGDKNTSLEVHGLSCRPCSKLGYNKCPKGHFKCMEIDISKLN